MTITLEQFLRLIQRLSDYQLVKVKDAVYAEVDRRSMVLVTPPVSPLENVPRRRRSTKRHTA